MSILRYSISLLYISQLFILCIREWVRVIGMMQKGAFCLPICILKIPSLDYRFVIELQFGNSNLLNGLIFVFILNLEDLKIVQLRQNIFLLSDSESMIRGF